MFGLLVATHPENPVFDVLAMAKGDDMYDTEIAADDLLEDVRLGREALYVKHLRVWREELSDDLRRFYMICTMCDPRLKGGEWAGCSDEDLVEMVSFFRCISNLVSSSLRVLISVVHTRALCLSVCVLISLLIQWSQPLVLCAKILFHRSEYEVTWAPSEPVSQSVIEIDLTPKKGDSPPAEANLFARFRAFKAGDGAKAEEPMSPAAPAPAAWDEVQAYLDVPAVPSSVRLLEWWAENRLRFPNLALMARQFLSVPATSASAERLFSLAGANFSDHRKNMTDEHLADLLFAKINVFMNRRFQGVFMHSHVENK